MSQTTTQVKSQQAHEELPEAKIDELLAAGDIAGARTEFERLCLEGLEGDPVAMTAEAWEQFRQDLHRKAKLAS
jgi:hypothetical protein